MLIGVNISPTWLSEAASVLNCRTESIPFMYLGLPIGGDGRKISFWKPVVDRTRAQLSVWNNTFLSFGGRPGTSEICHVLSSGLLSFFFQGTYMYNFLYWIFFFFKIPEGCKVSEKIAWVNWDSIYLLWIVVVWGFGGWGNLIYLY